MNRLHTQSLRIALVALLSSLAIASLCRGQTLDKGHRILLERGLQIHGQAFYRPEDLGVGSYTFDSQRYLDTNFTGVNWQWAPRNPTFSASSMPWGRWTNTDEAELTSAELPYKSSMVTFLSGEESNLNDPAVRTRWKNWFTAARPNFPDTILYTKQLAFDASDASMFTYMSESQPEMLFMNSYRWKVGNTEGTWHLFSDMQRYRRFALLGHDGTGTRPIPYGQQIQTFSGENLYRVPSESELRVHQFGAWAFGYTVTSDFTFNYGSSALFSPGTDTNSPTPVYNQVKEINRQGKNLGPALVRLVGKNIDGGVNFIAGKHKDGGGNTVTNTNPISVPGWTFNANDPYLRGWVVTNIGTKNDGLAGDVVLSWFKVLDEGLDGAAASEIYFMVLNGLTDPTGSAADCRQRIQLNFAFGSSGIDTLQRLNRDTGIVEDIFLPIIPDTGGRRQLTLELDGGTADLFKFKTGAVFVPEPSALLASIGFALAGLLRRYRR